MTVSSTGSIQPASTKKWMMRKGVIRCKELGVSALAKDKDEFDRLVCESSLLSEDEFLDLKAHKLKGRIQPSELLDWFLAPYSAEHKVLLDLTGSNRQRGETRQQKETRWKNAEYASCSPWLRIVTATLFESALTFALLKSTPLILTGPADVIISAIALPKFIRWIDKVSSDYVFPLTRNTRSDDTELQLTQLLDFVKLPQQNSSDSKRVMKAVQATNTADRILLKHLSPEELYQFLTGNMTERRHILEVSPPPATNQVLALRSLNHKLTLSESLFSKLTQRSYARINQELEAMDVRESNIGLTQNNQTAPESLELHSLICPFGI